MSRAARSLRTARLASSDGDAEGACNRAYYGAFNAARAALLMIGHKDAALAKSHSGLIVAFGRHVVKTGHLPAEHGRALSAILQIRMVADYSGDGVSEEDARAAIDMAEAFIAAIDALLAKKASR